MLGVLSYFESVRRIACVGTVTIDARSIYDCGGTCISLIELLIQVCVFVCLLSGTRRIGLSIEDAYEFAVQIAW